MLAYYMVLLHTRAHTLLLISRLNSMLKVAERLKIEGTENKVTRRMEDICCDLLADEIKAESMTILLSSFQTPNRYTCTQRKPDTTRQVGNVRARFFILQVSTVVY